MMSMLRLPFRPPVGLHAAQSRSLLADGIWATVARGGGGLLQVINLALVARLLPTDSAFASYVLAFSIATFGAAIGSIGLNTLVIRLVAKSLAGEQEDVAAAIVRRVLTLAFISAGGAGALFFIIAPVLCGGLFRAPLLVEVAGWVALWIAFQAAGQVAAEAFRGFHDIRSASIFAGLLQPLLVTAALLAMFLKGHTSLLQVVLVTAMAAGLNLACALTLLFRHTRGYGGALHEMPGVGSLLRQTLPLLTINVVALAMNNADLWIVGAVASKADVSIYGACGRLMMAVTMPLAVVNAVIPPRITQLHTQNRRGDLQNLLRSAASLAGIPSLGALLLLSLCGGWVLETAYGARFRTGTTVLTLLCLGQMVFCCGGLAAQALVMTGYAAVAMRINLTVFVIMVPVGCYAGYLYGAVGVAATAAAAVSIGKVILVLATRRLLGVWTFIGMDLKALGRMVRGQ